MCPMVMDGMECDQDECMFAHTQEELRPADPAGGALEPAEHREPRGELERPGEEAVGGSGPVAADDDEDDDFCFESPADGFKRGQTEDPLALCVRVMRVKNTFITIDEEEEDTEDKDVDRQHRRPLRSRSAPALARQRSEAPRPQRRPEQAAASQGADKGRGSAELPGLQPSASLPGLQPAARPHLPPTMGPPQQAKAPSLRAPRPASPRGPGAAAWPRLGGEGRVLPPQESASALGALHMGYGMAAPREPTAPWGDGGPCWWQKGHGAQREEGDGALLGGGRLHPRRQRGTPHSGGSGGSGGQSGSGGYSDAGSGSSAGSGDGLPYHFAGGGALRGGPPSGKLGEPVFIQPSWGGFAPGGQAVPGLEMRQAWTGLSAFTTGRCPVYTVAPAPSLSLLRCLGEQGGSGR
ncbi:unnamed protein product [Prorocentrum cordatum]|uniref:C3H1-type domain-containing protein n=1 Tax=Prorocentrum cordatum TaxID=2364126 RepID=A0ABN9SI54_9DINO|nr:unnamed protein product [Polarella glacialis]